MRLNIILVIAAIFATLGLTLAVERASAPQHKTQNVPLETPAPYERAGQPAPAFTFTRLDGTDGALADFRGKAIVLNFWASWCTPCIAEFPQLVALAQSLPDDIVILALSTDDDRAAIDRFLKRYGAGVEKQPNFIIAHDPQKKITQDIFQTIRLPETILIDANGIMREKIVGATGWNDPSMQEKLRKLTSP